MFETFVAEWWSQILAFVIFVAYLNRMQATIETRTSQLEKKVEQLFVLWNKHIDQHLNDKHK